jgi:hypothetical protein
MRRAPRPIEEQLRSLDPGKETNMDAVLSQGVIPGSSAMGGDAQIPPPPGRDLNLSGFNSSAGNTPDQMGGALDRPAFTPQQRKNLFQKMFGLGG